MARVKLTRKLVWAVATDEGNRSMRKGGRHAWSQEDYEAALAKYDALIEDAFPDEGDE